MRSTRLYLVGDLFDAGKCFTNVAKLNMKWKKRNINKDKEKRYEDFEEESDEV